MTLKTTTILTAILMTASACTKAPHAEEGPCMGRNTLMVDFAPAQTRVYVDGVRTLLHSEDLFSVFYRSSVNEQWVYTGNDGSTNGNLTACTDIERTGDTDMIYAVYPWSETASITKEVIATTLPTEQYFADGSYGRGAAVLAASISSVFETLNLRYASGFVRLRLSGNADVKEIKLSSADGKALAGACTIDISSGIPVLTATGTSSILLRNIDFSPVRIEATEDFIFSVAPGIYQEGVTFDITYTTGQVQTVKKSGPFAVTAGVLATPVEAVAQPLFTLEANFYIGGYESASPFDVTLTRDIVPGTSGQTTESDDIYLLTDTEKKYPFRFYISNKDSVENLRVTRSGLSFGGTTGDYILLPGIEDMRLVAVFLCIDGCTISINSEENITSTALISVAGAETGKACKLELRSNAVARIKNLILYYDNAL